MITASVLAAAMPGSVPADRPAWAIHLANACLRWHINTPLRVSTFLAQIAHESNELRRLEENLRYSKAARICAVWPTRFPTEASAVMFVRNPIGLANRVYANRLGNGDEASGDGWRYRGRGLIQLTGRANYREARQAVGSADYEAQPEMLMEPAVAAQVAGWFWESRGCNALADGADFVAITRRVNGGLVGLSDRQRYWALAKAALANTSGGFA